MSGESGGAEQVASGGGVAASSSAKASHEQLSSYRDYLSRTRRDSVSLGLPSAQGPERADMFDASDGDGYDGAPSVWQQRALRNMLRGAAVARVGVPDPGELGGQTFFGNLAEQ